MPTSINKRLGYLLIDNRASPGVSEEFVRSTGKLAPVVTEGKLFEADTYCCPHCSTVVIKNPLRTRPRTVCRKCMKVICDNAACHIDCVPIKKVLDDLEKSVSKNLCLETEQKVILTDLT